MRIKLGASGAVVMNQGGGNPPPVSSPPPASRLIIGHRIATVVDATVCRAAGSMPRRLANQVAARKPAGILGGPELDAELVRAWGAGIKLAPSRAAILATARGAVRLAFGRERSLLTWTEVKRALDRATE